MGTWLNSDGLYIKYGTDEAALTKGGEIGDFFQYNEHQAEFVLSGATATYDFAAVGSDKILSDTLVIPAGARISGCNIYVETAFTSGGSATLQFGLIRTDRSTAIDDDGLLAATAVATLVSNYTTGGTGALVGTTLASDALVTAKVATAAFTAGKCLFRVRWYMPSTVALA
jgi:hypothetical protein